MASSAAGQGRNLFLLLALTVLYICLAGVAIVCLRKVTHLEDQMQTMEESMHDRPYLKIEGRLYYQQPGEEREAWVLRVKGIVSGQESVAQYLCDTLTMCDVPGGEVEVCTPCNSSPPSAQCIANHQADVDAACAAFDCGDCGD